MCVYVCVSVLIAKYTIYYQIMERIISHLFLLPSLEAAYAPSHVNHIALRDVLFAGASGCCSLCRPIDTS